VSRPSDLTRRPGEPGSFGVARERWLGGLPNVRNVVRQEIITRQLGNHLPDRPCRVLDVGAGQGTQTRQLARAGHWVVAVEPDPEMRSRLRAALRTDPADVGERVKVVAGSVGDLGSSIAADSYDVVLCLGVLMYLPEGRPAITELARYVAPGGLLCVAVRTPVSAVWRPAARQDWHAALAAIDESAKAQVEGRDMRYLNEIGAPARTDDIDTIAVPTGCTARRRGVSRRHRPVPAACSARSSHPAQTTPPASAPETWLGGHDAKSGVADLTDSLRPFGSSHSSCRPRAVRSRK
jgi:S-adenosylmethionine-dependent methyltransferase